MCTRHSRLRLTLTPLLAMTALSLSSSPTPETHHPHHLPTQLSSSRWSRRSLWGEQLIPRLRLCVLRWPGRRRMGRVEAGARTWRRRCQKPPGGGGAVPGSVPRVPLCCLNRQPQQSPPVCLRQSTKMAVAKDVPQTPPPPLQSGSGAPTKRLPPHHHRSGRQLLRRQPPQHQNRLSRRRQTRMRGSTLLHADAGRSPGTHHQT